MPVVYLPSAWTLAVSPVDLSIGLIVGLIVGAAGSVLICKLIGARTIGDARREAEQLKKTAESDAQTLRKQLELDFRNELAQRREAFEKETDKARDELKEHERRLVKREDNLDRKLDVLETKEKYLNEQDAKVRKREEAVEQEQAKLVGMVEEHQKLLETAREEQKQITLRLANLSPDEARKEALQLVEHEVQHEAAMLIQRQTARAEEESRETALKITLQAIQRYASEHTSENTVSAIAIPSDDMKGRVIGREGRNIRAFEKATGVDVIVDDTPGVVVVSCFDPVRRAIAAEALQKLIDDGRIHPTRIEEIVEQIEKDMEQRIVKYGSDAAIEADL